MTDFDYAAFFDEIRDDVNLTRQNVPNMTRVIQYGLTRNLGVNQFAYVLATAWWESSATMAPVVEAFWLSEAWRKKNLRYYPFHGRGLIQVTWKANYEKLADLLDLPTDFFVDDPDKLLEWEYALPALFIGMERGLYTGRDLDDYIDDVDETDDEDLREYINARRIVNGTDRDKAIGKLAVVFELGLKVGGYDE